MCLTHKKIREKNKVKTRAKNKQKYGIKIVPVTEPEKEFTMDETILCNGCFKRFPLDDIQINCHGCDKFYHCKIAGTCNGINCRALTNSGNIHKLSWCTYCVPSIPENREKKSRTDSCICNQCVKSPYTCK